MTDEIERRARLIAGALYGAYADALVFSSATRIGGMMVCPERTEMMPLWMLYLRCVEKFGTSAAWIEPKPITELDSSQMSLPSWFLRAADWESV